MSISEKSLAAVKDRLPSILGDPEVNSIRESRDHVLARYGPLFQPSKIGLISKAEFLGFLAFENNCHWPLHRQGPSMTSDMVVLRSALEILVDESSPIEQRFTTSIQMIKGFGKGTASAILLVAYPNKYGVWNTKSEQTLKSIGIWNPDSSLTAGENYSIVNDVLIRLSEDLKLDLWTLDSVWWRWGNNQKFSGVVQDGRPDPTELPSSSTFPEGAKTQITVNSYERNSKARVVCLKHYGYKCQVCEFTFESKYFELGKDFIHVHHVIDIHLIGEQYEVDPIKDLIPVCPNCHAMLHRTTPALTVEKLRAIIHSQ